MAVRALVLRTLNVPNDGRVNPPSFLSCFTIASIRAPAAWLAATPVQSVACWMTPAMKALLIGAACPFLPHVLAAHAPAM
jgi:hypothetical protein